MATDSKIPYFSFFFLYKILRIDSKETNSIYCYRILQHFNTFTSNYSVVFTANATAALKTLAETFDFNYHGEAKENADIKIPGSFVYTIDNHVSVLGMREIVQTNHIRSIERSELLQNMERPENINSTHLFLPKNSSLVVFPAQSNFCGFKYPLDLIGKIHRNGLHERQKHDSCSTEWYICLDAACLAATSPLDLTRYPADFVSVSFSKMFGYPTGLGCLLISKRAENVLSKKYYGGGTIKVALGTKNWHQKRDVIHERFEDGTISYLSIVSLQNGFSTIERLVPPYSNFSTMDRISRHVFTLARYFYHEASKLKHTNGASVVQFYNETKYKSSTIQGGICALILLNPDGTYVGYSEFNCIASVHKIHVRTGCFCNPGACQRFLELSDEIVLYNFEAGHICGDAVDLVDGQPTGAIRISFGYMTGKRNVDALLDLIRKYFIDKVKIEPCMTKPIELRNGEYSKKDTNGNVKSCQIKLKEICLYPIKSCAAFKVQKWPLNQRGLKYDREWLIVRENGVALTQKHETRLCLIRPIITDEHLVLTFPNTTSVLVELNPSMSKNSFESVSLCQSKVCNDNIQGDDCGDEVAKWLSIVLNIPGLRLIRQADTQKRFMKDNTKEISLANKSQFLLVNMASINWLASQVAEWQSNELDYSQNLLNVSDRFRGNLIVETTHELEENKFLRLMCENGVELEVDGPCTRCQMICIDQNTGEKTAEPLRTLVKALEGKMRFGVYFSQVTKKSETENEVRFIDCDNKMYAFYE